MALDPGLTAAWNGLGWVRLRSGDSAGADEAFQAALKLNPKIPGALNGLGYLRFDQRKYDQAEGYWLEAIKYGATAPYDGLARLYLLTGRFDEAAKWTEKAIQEQAALGVEEPALKRMLAAAKARNLDPDLRRLLDPAAAESQPVGDSVTQPAD